MTTLKTAMREAFDRAILAAKSGTKALVFNDRSGCYRPRQMWNANLSFRTYSKLKSQGVMA